MPQEFQVLRCYRCLTFQVHQVKKVLKYNCKVCGEKQSIKKVYGRGTGADCRRHVQKCNMLRCELDMAAESKLASPSVGEQHLVQADEAGPSGDGPDNVQALAIKGSRWLHYIKNKDNDNEDYDHDNYTTDRRQFDHTKKENRKEARQRWKSWQEKKYGSYKSPSNTHQYNAFSKPGPSTSDLHTTTQAHVIQNSWNNTQPGILACKSNDAGNNTSQPTTTTVSGKSHIFCQKQEIRLQL